jgi:NAD(P)-dependent dehydrogenase (short-subunit alcohol dehydrogenase family)
MPVALITGASRGFGRAVARELAGQHWTLVLTARGASDLHRVAMETGRGHDVLPGDVTDPAHRLALANAVRRHGRLDLLLNNASALGPSPLPRVADLPLPAFDDVLLTNVLAPFALTQLLLGDLIRSDGLLVNVSSDAAVEAYPGWGAYGSAKAALDQLTAVLAVEEPGLRAYAFDPGDMRTDLHQAAYPGEDISDRPEPETVVPALLALLLRRPPSGRYRASDLLAGVPA